MPAPFLAKLGRVKGKSVRVNKPTRVEIDIVWIPRDFYALHKFVTLVGDVMFVDGLPFLLTRSRDISRTTPFLHGSAAR